ncbi:hypothetical protein A2276_00655 [candidate division WOR-1 bacterium RIFOXYA12_FULL_43_27]|uniref:Inner membrane protein YgaP-like transmembrane domain-containing protein n=1 Tax=candidate division WOR-1 bacterium RIFOXYC2_FULL_46_14 TaxID=1802587 RepID=A0A1F4U4R3_UNCSA|nr:MAG: hypothetical protein A2276_00655 [candidate division WOR-1 bacterium RIFOXYA12_FULL_43_27]OGC20799.1 MAG: hypothetical protein A2292_07220 [candidate division WOR-1 bacterium RIFOXYB2_FULL_46_45]OGC31464.1 MAG: hypothetical protein A2232_04230 [candidate division WOR-1 bacterium RIFOXYA2_FULL_46_56]OGC39869.1 MAG: hypothetical protein A2438_05065 [candidate division WOR-1 bacterium RIFOXYC2_FULL_46_14]
MKNNLGSADRIVRVLLGLTFVYVALYAPVSVAMMWTLTMAAIILIATGIASFCPLYAAIRFKSCC